MCPKKKIIKLCALKKVLLASKLLKQNSGDFPGGAVVMNPPANAGDTGFIPGPGRSHRLRNN